jgi:prefoldin alpha subunit
MSSDEETLRRLIIESQVLQGTFDTLQRRLSMIENVLAQLQVANATLQGLKDKGNGEFILVPVGGGTHIKAELVDSEKVIVSIGAGVATEKTFDGAQESIGHQMSEFQKTRMVLQQQLNQTATKLEDTQEKAQSMMEAMKGKQIV